MSARARSAVILGALLLALAPALFGEGKEWPQWRGPGRDGQVAADLAEVEWPEQLTRAWSVAVGAGYSSPVVAGGVVFVHGRSGEDEVVTAYRSSDGEELWSDRYAAPFATNSYATGHGKGPFATPLVAGGTLYTLGVNAVLSAYDASGGELEWRRELVEAVDSSKLFCGTASSPLLVDGAIVVYVGDDRGGRLVAVEAASGAVRWERRGDGPGYASPIVAELDGVRQVVTLSDGAAVAVAVAGGEPLWRLPFPDEWNENIVTPLVDGERLILAGVRRGSFAVAPRRAEPDWRLETVWDRPERTLYMSSPVLVDGTLYGMSNKLKGHLFALDAATGVDRWMGEGRQGESASLLAAGERLLTLTTAGVLTVLDLEGESPRELARYELSEQDTWPHPAIADGVLLVRDRERLTAWQLPSRP